MAVVVSQLHYSTKTLVRAPIAHYLHPAVPLQGSRAEKEDRQLKARAAAAGRKRGATDRDQQPPRSGGQDQPAADGWLDDVANHEGTGEGHPGDPDGPDDVDDGRGVGEVDFAWTTSLMAQEQMLNMKNSKNQRSFPGMIL